MKKILQILRLAIMLAFSISVGRAQPNNPLVHEGIVHAPMDQVWEAYATKAGLESWMAAHADVDLRIGGAMKTQHDPKGSTDDATAIVNTILSFEPRRMISLKVIKFPEGFPFPNAIREMWTIVYFEAQGKNATCVREVCLGFGPDDESRKMREFFNLNNAFTLELLQKRFAPVVGVK